MQFTLGELLDIQGNLKKLSEIKDVPALVGYKIATVLRKLSGPITDAEKSRNELIKKFSGPPDKDNLFRVSPENMALYLNELTDLLSEEVEIDIREVKLPAEIKLPDATTLIGLDKFITV
jgi:hypothetical protein